MNFHTGTSTIHTKIKNKERKPSIYESLFKPLPVCDLMLLAFFWLNHELFAITEEFFFSTFINANQINLFTGAVYSKTISEHCGEWQSGTTLSLIIYRIPVQILLLHLFIAFDPRSLKSERNCILINDLKLALCSLITNKEKYITITWKYFAFWTSSWTYKNMVSLLLTLNIFHILCYFFYC